MTLPFDVARCAGVAPHSPHQCPRKNDCARYLSGGGIHSPFYLSVCEQGDKFIAWTHGANVSDDDTPGNPANKSLTSVMNAHPVRTGGESA